MLEPFFYCSSLTDINTICIRLMLVVNNAIVIFIFKCPVSVPRINKKLTQGFYKMATILERVDSKGKKTYQTKIKVNF